MYEEKCRDPAAGSTTRYVLRGFVIQESVPSMSDTECLDILHCGKIK
jgi:hypothetical protein